MFWYVRLISLLLVILYVSLVSPLVHADFTSDLNSIYNGTTFYDSTSTECQVTVPVVNISGSDNIEKAYNFLVLKGLTAAQASGIVGNLIQESNVNPLSTNSIGAYGIAQWLGNRLTVLKSWTEAEGKDPSTLEGQLDFLWYEASYRKDIDAVKQTSTPEEAARVWELKFERASTVVSQRRIDMANAVYTKYGAGSGATITVSSSSGCSGATASGQNTRYIDGFTVYSQYDPAWKDLPYGKSPDSSTIGDSGCGPSALAMVITTLTGEKVTPVDTTKFATSKDLYIKGVGSSWDISPVLVEHWHLQSTKISADVATISANLEAGALIVTSGKGPIPFTSEGHFIVIRGVTATGKFKVGDSAHNDANDQEWDPAQITSNMNAGNVYAIYK